MSVHVVNNLKIKLEARRQEIMSIITSMRGECRGQQVPFWYNSHDYQSGAWAAKEGRILEELEWIDSVIKHLDEDIEKEYNVA